MMPTAMNSAPVVTPWLISTKHRALEPARVEREDAERGEAHVAHAGVGDELLQVGLGQRGEAAVEDGDDREPEDIRREDQRGVGRDRQAEPQEAVRAHLEQNAASSTLPAVGASTWAAGSHVWNGNIGTLIAKEMKNAAKIQPWKAALYARPIRSGIAERAGRQAQGDERHQQEDRARHRVDEELERGVDPPRAAPHADQQRHGNQHRLPEHEEEDRSRARRRRRSWPSP